MLKSLPLQCHKQELKLKCVSLCREDNALSEKKKEIPEVSLFITFLGKLTF